MSENHPPMDAQGSPRAARPAQTVRRTLRCGWRRWAVLGLVVGVAGWLVYLGVRRPVPRVVNRPLPQGVYLWQRQWTAPVRAAVRGAAGQDSAFNELLVFGAEIVAADPPTPTASVNAVSGLDWSLLAGTARPVGIVVRVRGTPGAVGPRGKVFGALRETLANLCAQAKRAGVRLEEVQVDFDCPTSHLDGFAEVLKALRRDLPGERWTFTALPAWLRVPAFAALAGAADGYVLQVHSFAAVGADDLPPATLCDPGQARQAVEKAARLGIPFRVALPTYSYRLVLDARGRLLAAAAEGAPLEQAQPPPGGSIRRLEADPVALAALVAGWKTERPAALQGVVWYRLPVPGSDRLNWPPVTLAAVMAGRAPKARLTVELAPSNENALWELRLHNAGEADAFLPPTAQVRCPVPPLAVEGLGAYEVAGDQPTTDGARLILWRRRDDADTERHLPPGATLVCGWLRLPPETRGEPTAVLPSAGGP